MCVCVCMYVCMHVCLVNMDTRTVNIYKNGEFLGKAWNDLHDEVCVCTYVSMYVCVCI